jgi:hypothetical protein
MLVTDAGNAIDVRGIAMLIALAVAAVIGATELRGIVAGVSAILAIVFGFYLSMIGFTMVTPLIMTRLRKRGSR